jgi:peptidoglycan-associated lipoprotein
VKLQFSTILCFVIGAAAMGCQASASGSFSTETPQNSVETAEVEEAPAPVADVEDPDDVHIDGDHLVIDRHINFATNSHEILEDSFDLLDHIAQLLKNHPEITTLHVIGHTDNSGSAEHNMKLSASRAQSVMDALRQRGVTQTIDSAGKGKTQPLCKEDTDECHRKNRRVEFLIEKS